MPQNVKLTMLVALVIVLVGGALFLLLPLVLGSGGTPFPISPQDHISSWSWKGVYADGGDKQDQTKMQIQQLKNSFGKGQSDDYDLDVGIASEYELLGDGQNSYTYLSRAINLNTKRGLAYMNMGHLMEELGAFTTAHTAYDDAVAAEPTNPIFSNARENFLIHHASATP